MAASETEVTTEGGDESRELSPDLARDLTDRWAELARTGGESLVGTVAGFVETVERTLPVGAGAAKQRQIIDSGLGMARAVARAPYRAVRGIVDSFVLVNVNVDSDLGVDVGVDVDVLSREHVTRSGVNGS